jgi:hypothetical protein
VEEAVVMEVILQVAQVMAVMEAIVVLVMEAKAEMAAMEGLVVATVGTVEMLDE